VSRFLDDGVCGRRQAKGVLFLLFIVDEVSVCLSAWPRREGKRRERDRASVRVGAPRPGWPPEHADRRLIRNKGPIS
jgi:hypothetical protein